MKNAASELSWRNLDEISLEQTFIDRECTMCERFTHPCRRGQPRQLPPWIDRKLKAKFKLGKTYGTSSNAHLVLVIYILYTECRNARTDLKIKKRREYEEGLAEDPTKTPKRLFAYSKTI